MKPTTIMVAIASAFVSTCDSRSTFQEVVDTNATESDAEQFLLSELANLAKHNHASERITKLKDLLRPLYNAVPKDGAGKVSHTVVIYTLQRFFAKHRGWTIRGLEPNGSSQENVTSTSEMQGWIPQFLQTFLEHVLDSTSLNLAELAAIAATLEDFIEKEEGQWLEKVYNLFQYSKDASLTKSEVFELLEIYLMIFNADGKLAVQNPKALRAAAANFAKRQSKLWNSFVAFMTQHLDATWTPSLQAAPFDEVLRIVRDIGEHYSTVYDADCSSMKDELLRIESMKPGRVRLTDFYKLTLYGGVWEFNEKVDYLRAFGALDESDPKTPLVIIPNYMGGRLNCLTASNYYALCCRNECDDLLASLEDKIAAPVADHLQVLEIVQSLSSRTITAPRNLSATLVNRLARVAELNFGQIPLHGRLFAQWMHHAFPRECAYPHEAGTATPLTPDEWMKESGQDDSKATQEEMMAHVRQDTCRFTPDGVACGRQRGLLSASQASASKHSEADLDLPWSEKEELLVVRAPLTQTVEPASKTYLKDGVVFVVLASMVSALTWSFRPFLKIFPASAAKPDRCIV